jgi:hypothetical protein
MRELLRDLERTEIQVDAIPLEAGELDDAVGTGSMDLNTTHRLSIAAKVLSSTLMDRLEMP